MDDVAGPALRPVLYHEQVAEAVRANPPGHSLMALGEIPPTRVRPWLSVIVSGESLVSHVGGVLLVETARRSGLAGQLSIVCTRMR